MNRPVKQSLRIGIIVSNSVIYQWQYSAIDSVLRSDSLSICFIASTEEKSGQKQGKNHSVIRRLHEIIDRIISHDKSGLLSAVSIRKITGKIPLIYFTPVIKQDFIELDSVSCNQISVLNPDIILNFSSLPLNINLAGVPRLGTCEFKAGYHDDGYDEVVKQCPATLSALLFRTNTPFLNSFAETWLGQTYAYLIHINKVRAWKRVALLLERFLTGLSELGETYLETRSRIAGGRSAEQLTRQSNISGRISDWGNLLTHLRIIVLKLADKLFYTKSFQWFVLMSPVSDQFPSVAQDIGKRRMLPPSDRFWADPFIISREGQNYIFVEELPFKSNKGHIAVIESDSTGSILQTVTVLNKPYHLSYPFVFDHNGNYYMVPETGENKTIEIYQCTDFPYKWDFVMNLMENLDAKDTTLFYHQNKWWLFTSVCQSGIDSDYSELFLFYSDNLLTANWIPHPANPVISDITSARCAGKIFVHNQQIYRPSQDCSQRYGRAYNLNIIEKLTEQEYTEVKMLTIEPETIHPDFKGVHTFNRDQGYMVLDAYTFRRRF